MNERGEIYELPELDRQGPQQSEDAARLQGYLRGRAEGVVLNRAQKRKLKRGRKKHGRQ